MFIYSSTFPSFEVIDSVKTHSHHILPLNTWGKHLPLINLSYSFSFSFKLSNRICISSSFHWPLGLLDSDLKTHTYTTITSVHTNFTWGKLLTHSHILYLQIFQFQLVSGSLPRFYENTPITSSLHTNFTSWHWSMHWTQVDIGLFHLINIHPHRRRPLWGHTTTCMWLSCNFCTSALKTNNFVRTSITRIFVP